MPFAWGIGTVDSELLARNVSLLRQPTPRFQYERVVVVDVEVPEASGVTVVVELLAGSRTVSA